MHRVRAVGAARTLLQAVDQTGAQFVGSASLSGLYCPNANAGCHVLKPSKPPLHTAKRTGRKVLGQSELDPIGRASHRFIVRR
jgi:hypothetical protein